MGFIYPGISASLYGTYSISPVTVINGRGSGLLQYGTVLVQIVTLLVRVQVHLSTCKAKPIK